MGDKLRAPPSFTNPLEYHGNNAPSALRWCRKEKQEEDDVEKTTKICLYKDLQSSSREFTASPFERMNGVAFLAEFIHKALLHIRAEKSFPKFVDLNPILWL